MVRPDRRHLGSGARVRRRTQRLVLGTALLGLLALVAAGVWFVWLPGYRPGLQPGERYGVDISAYQGRVDWPVLAHDDIGFVYIKATEGSNFVDRDSLRTGPAPQRPAWHTGLTTSFPFAHRGWPRRGTSYMLCSSTRRP